MVRTWLPLFALLATLGAPAAGQETPDPASATAAAAATSACELAQPPVEPVPATQPNVIPGRSDRPDEFWVRADYLGWWLTGAHLPPLMATSPPGTPRAQAGVLGAPATQVVFGGEGVQDDYRSGVRVSFGGWLDECRTTGFEVRALILDRLADRFTEGSPDGSAVIALPFVDATTGRPRAQLVSFPGVVAGVSSADAESSKFWMFDALCRKSYCRDCTRYVDLVAGYRFLQYGDRVRVIEDLAPLEAPGSKIDLVDEFNASNRFNGGVIGLAAGYTDGSMSVELQAHVAVGVSTRTVGINGATRIASPVTGVGTFPGGLLAQETNIGSFRSSDWAVVPDAELTLGWWLTNNCRFLFGYSVLYWPGVTRAGQQIDIVVNPTQLSPTTLVGPARPAFVLHQSDLWVQGFSVGVEFRY